MTTYPSGVLQNYSAPNLPPDLRPIAQENWKRFSTLPDAQEALEMIRSLSPGAQMVDATKGMYAQYVYFLPNPDIRCRIAAGKVEQPGKPALSFGEYPGEIFDASTTPRPFIDTYTAGQTPVLKCAEVAPGLGQLYWAAPDKS